MTGCCEELADAIRFGFIEEIGSEFMLSRRQLVEVDPDATAGNVLTGESYDPGEFALALAIRFCPFCRSGLAP